MFRKSVLLGLLISCCLRVCCADDIGEGSGSTHDDSWFLTTREILLNLYDSGKGLRWTTSTGWLQSKDFCSWYGITCYGNETTTDLRRIGFVQKLDLSNNHLVGSIPVDLWSLPYIQQISLRDNPDLNVDFTKVNQASYLTVLNVANTLVTSLQGIGQLSNRLQTLQVASLGLDGPLPDELFNLTNLRGFYANYNHFNGTLPTELGSLTELTDLYLYYNDFTGQIPSEIGLLTGLKVLTMAQNAFSGSLPTELNRLSNLQIFAVHRILDQEKGTGIRGQLPSFARLQSISQLYLENQALTGPIPSDFLASANPQAVLKVNLMNNKLSGAVPTELTQLARLQLLLAGNKITVVSDDICKNNGGWMGGAVQDLNTCNAFLCPPTTYAPDGRATKTDTCSPCAANTIYYGATTCSSATTATGDSVSERQVLIELYNRMGGKNWKKSDKWLNLAVDACDWEGIHCNSNRSITDIVLKNNDLVNSPPPELFTLANLRNLNFNGNSIDFSFLGISQATSLEFLDLSQTDLTSLESINELSATNIQRLLIASNLLQGTIPQTLFTLKSLETLDFSDNHFKGSLPSQVKQLSALKHLRCFGNSLTGQIPSEIGILTGLTEFSCNENQFNGTLPNALNGLTNLQILSLRQSSTEAAIGGRLLDFANLAQLTDLHLDSNMLTGSLPTNFLQYTLHTSDRIEVVLSDNMLTGVIPKSWGSSFDKLFIDLAGNKITGIDPSLCNKEGWMDGQVSSFQCNAILCPANTYNEVGRQADAYSDCTTCSASSNSNILGSKNCGGANLTDQFSLLETFYYSVSGNTWLNNSGWLNDENICQTWFGISCDSNGHVSKIALNANGLQGTVASSIFRLSSLSELNLANNSISFPFNGISKASQLEVLNLESVGLNSLDGVGQGTSLLELHLTDNDLTSLPSELFRLSKLQNLYLNYNQITGRIPTGIALMSSLQELFLYRNRLTGQIPASFGLMTNLKILALAGNDIGGTLPPELNNMTALEVLSIQREIEVNASQGVVDVSNSAGVQGPLLSFNKLKFLKWLYLAGNGLTGSIPFDFLDSKVNKTEEMEIDLTSNQLTGQLPASLTQFAQLNLFVADNQITKIALGLCLETLWLHGEVSALGCDAILCPNNTYSDIGRAEQASDTSCTPCPSGSVAPFYGSLQCFNSSELEVSTERDTLKKFYQATGGSEWSNNENWLDPNESICSWFGVYCIDPDQESVAGIVLERNGLIGTVPTSIYKLSNLNELNLAGNEIVFDFRGIEQVPSLGFLDLDEIGLSSVAGLEKSSVVVLHIGGNKFGGKFPNEILKLSNLESLYMSGNNFGSQLPSDIGKLSELAFLECGRCGLSGKLPTWIGSLDKLQYLSLYQNSLSGSLPPWLAQLSKLTHLDLSVQKLGFGGALPDFANMTQLTELVLSGNSFNGTIPSTFLSGLNATSDPVTVNLENNQISGPIPTGLSRFANMSLYLSDNQINFIPPVLCDRSSSWNQGDVRKYGCDGILCGNGTYNSYGRATGSVNCSRCADSTWLGASFCGEVFFNESNVLITFFKDTNGFGWLDSDGWFEDVDFCDWAGISCKNGNIQTIKLNNNNLIGSVSSSIWQLPHLVELDLSENNVVVSFKGIEKASVLTILQLSETNVSSLTGIGGAASLAELHLTSTEMKGAIPSELFNLTKLEKLYLNDNELSGILPTLIGSLTSLQELYLLNNKLTGQIPSEIGLLSSNVRVISVGGNTFTGAIPDMIGFGNFPNLEILSFQGQAGQHPSDMTSFFGSRPPGLSGTLPPFFFMPNLRELYLGYASLTGSIPSTFLQLANTAQSIIVDLTNNALTGSIPTQLTNFKNLSLYLAGNQINNVPKEICAMKGWLEGDLALSCDAFLCPPGTYNLYGRQVGSTAPCKVCALDTPLAAIYYGSLSCGLFNPENMTTPDKLTFLFNATSGNQWNHKDNWLTNTTFCEWYGVTCDDKGIIGLNLASNNLQGTVPSAIYYLPSLQVLNIAGNKVDISFDYIELAENLKELHLNSSSVSSINGVGKAPNLEILFAGKSQLAGNAIPDEFYQLTRLKKLDLSNNGLIGTLSTAVGNLANLLYFDCQFNDLSGEIPSEIGSLTLLQVLDLSENTIGGTLPLSMNSMRSLQTLRVNSNTLNIAGITGPLLSFSSSSNLTELSFGSNSLTGSLPDDLLSGVQESSKPIMINLQSNQLTGTIPSSYSRFRSLDLELGGNLIKAIGDGLCDLSGWMNGDVGRYSCDGILCPLGTFNALGRQTQNKPCLPCPDAVQLPFLGGISCYSLEKSKERDVLKTFFTKTGGENWYAKDGWLDDSKDFCEWYGVSCGVDGTVTALVLGGNNLVGTPPKELFELLTLQYLWLYSNPIQFSFQGIEQAFGLRSLLLGATGLTSLDGIGNARALMEIDVRFNGLRGPLPAELSKLRNLESFSCSDNMLSGTVASFSSNTKLATLRMSNNKFTGSLPSFALHRNLTSIDVSSNLLEGDIPNDLLQALGTSQRIFLDLSSNHFSGTVPTELSRFSDLTILLKDNQINGVSPDLCSQSTWNDGDVGAFKCDGILCPPKTFAVATGRASLLGTRCESCDSAAYFGTSTCGSKSGAASHRMKDTATALVLSILVGLCVLAR